MITTHNILHNC